MQGCKLGSACYVEISKDIESSKKSKTMHGIIYILASILLSVTGVKGFLQGPLRSFKVMASRDMTTSLLAAEEGISGSYKKFCVNVNLYVKPERREEFLKVIAINSAGTLANEPLNISYTWGESTTEKNTFHFQEQFKGKEGFDAHTQSPHFAVWRVFTEAEDSPFWKPPTVFFFESS